MKLTIANVLDTEATCYEGGIFPEGERQEIIEFGITTVDLPSLTIVKTYSIPVVPVLSTVSEYCTNLTGWTYARLKRQGVPFSVAVDRIIDKYGGRNRLLVPDSSRDLELLQDQCRLMNVPYPFGAQHLNVSVLFALITRRRRTVGLDKMMRQLALEFEGTRHRAGDDSKNIARILVELLRQTPPVSQLPRLGT